MPELPEVETLARGLQRELAGRRMLSVELGKTDFMDNPAEIERELPGTQIQMMDGNFATLIRGDSGGLRCWPVRSCGRSCCGLAPIPCKSRSRSLESASAAAGRGSRRCCWIRECCAGSATSMRMKVCGRPGFIRRGSGRGYRLKRSRHCILHCNKSWKKRLRWADRRFPTFLTPRESR